MTKKLLYLLILLLLIPSFSYATGVIKWSTIPYGTQGLHSCVITFTGYTQQDTCVWNPAATSNTCTWNGPSCTAIYNSESGSGCTNSPSMGCSQVVYVAPAGACNIQDYENSVGGCGSSPIYCSTSTVYQQVSNFLGAIGTPDSYDYFTTIGTNGNSYRCASSTVKGSSVTLFYPQNWLPNVNPIGNSKCLSGEAFNALEGTHCGSMYGRNTGYYTNNNTKQTTQNPTENQTTPVPPGSTILGPSGKPITEPTGYDNDGDGFDDVTGQPLPPGSGGIGDSDGDGTAEVEIKDPDPDEIPAVPSGGEYDTEITSPEKTPLSGLFDIINSSPFVSVIQGTHISLSGSRCLLTTANPVYGQHISFDFCDSNIVNILDYLGIIIVGIAAILAILLIFV